jgi:hypothetical protein
MPFVPVRRSGQRMITFNMLTVSRRTGDAVSRAVPSRSGLPSLCALAISGLATLACGGNAHSSASSGSYPSCPALPRVNAGATTGALTLRGHITDASGAAVVGGRIDLSGDASAVRYSDFTGGFTFHASAGSYTLKASGDCTLTPNSVSVNSLTADAVYDFSAANDGCVTSTEASATATGSVRVLSQGGAEIAAPAVSVMVYASPAAAGARLQDIAAEDASPPCSLQVDGNPAIEIQTTDTVPGPLNGPDITQLDLTTAIAVGNIVARFGTALGEGTGPLTAPPTDTVNRVLALGRDFTVEELPELHSP